MEDRRSPYGERGLKYPVADAVREPAGRSPYGERGLKYHRQHATPVQPAGRSPYGERGLK